MESMGHAINEAIKSERWKPISLGRGGSILLYIFFADNLVLFGEASMENTKAINMVLDKFWCYSGHKVNAAKFLLFFLTQYKRIA